MKQLILFIVYLFAGVFPVHAQQSVGYAHSENEPLGGVFSNPAGIVGNRYEAALNVFSGNVFVTTNAIGLQPFSAAGTKKYSVLTGTGAKELYGNVDLQLPSFIINLDAVQTIGFTSRLRMIADAQGMSNELFRFVTGDTTQVSDHLFTQPATTVNVHEFMDLGVTYGRMLFQNSEHLFKMGITMKFYLGMAAGSFHIKDATLRLANDATIEAAAGAVNILYSDGFDAVYDGKYGRLKKEALGYGFDFGVLYEWKKPEPDSREARYTLRIGVSVTDLGRMKYKTSQHAAMYALDLQDVNFADLFDLGFTSMTDYLNYVQEQGFFVKESVPATFLVALPACLRINADYNVYKNFFVNGFASWNLKSAKSYGAAYASHITLSPRWEGRDFSVYTPAGYYFPTHRFHWGVGIHAGYFHIGSANLLTNLLSKHATAMDIFAGIHIPIGNVNAAPPPKMPEIVRETPRY